ncbi:MAG: alpha/beta fold hydrolase [Solirubrobacteraceae bacterium]|nr:alpha/beta fold hydrolase [Solirubrobacteraceae bacterium]
MTTPSRPTPRASQLCAGVRLSTANHGGGAASAFAGGSPGFYTPPSSLPADNGAIIRSESMKLGVNLPSPDGKATRIMYRSTDTNDQPVAVTGTYIEPKAAWKGAGARPLVTYAEGTQGQGDKCAPSYSLENAIGGGIGYEVPNISKLVSKGFAVVVTDYVGLGTTDRVHTYVNRLDQGRAVLDAARAALRVPGASVTASSAVGAYGYSQGGGATASAAELAPTYAPDVNLKGVYAGAPPADLNAVMKTADGTSLTAVIGFAVNGFLETYPQLQSVLDAETNQAGKDALAKIATGCIGEGLAGFAFQKTSKWTTSGKSISEVVAGRPEVKAIVDAQRIGTLKPSVPVRLVTGTQDDIVTHGQVKQLAVDWCAKGASVSYVPVIQLFGTGGTSLNHLVPMLTEGDGAVKWLSDRLAGTTATSNCASVPTMK